MNKLMRSDIKILDKLLALNLNISLWSARKKLNIEDFGNVQLPPEDLATLGSKRIAPPESLRIFCTLKARTFNFLDRHGLRFMSGWAIPEDKAPYILKELIILRDEFQAAKSTFLLEYDKSMQGWLTRHAQWNTIIADSIVSPDYVKARMGFTWQLYKVAPASGIYGESGLQAEVQGLADTLFREIAQDADLMWKRVYVGKAQVTHKALSPLRTLRDKLLGLSFVAPHVLPVASLIQTALNSMPKRGNLQGTHLVVLQGLVSLLRQPDSLVLHAQSLLELGDAPRDLGENLNDLVQQPALIIPEPEETENATQHVTEQVSVLESLGLW